MFQAEDISIYFSKLPLDGIIHISGEEHHVNKFHLSHFSEPIATLFQQSDEITLPFEDEHHLFSSVLDFLQMKEISVNHLNDFPLNRLATNLKIQELIGITQQSISKPLSIYNSISRLYFNPDNLEYLNYIKENIEKLQSDKQIFTLPYNILLEIFNDNDSKFQNSNSRLIFGCRCATVYQNNISDFIPNFLDLPEEVIQLITTDEEFLCLEDKLPIFDYIMRLIDRVANIRTAIDKLQHENEINLAQISELNKEKREAESDLESLNQRLGEITKQKSIVLNQIEETAQEIDRDIEMLDKYKITNAQIGQLRSAFAALEQMYRKIAEDLRQFGYKKILNPEAYKTTSKILHQWQERMAPLQNLVEHVRTNEADINEVKENLAAVSRQLREIS